MSEFAGLIEERLERGEVDLPIFPQSVSEVLSLCARDDVDIRGIATSIHRDPTLAAHMLRIANSPLVAPKAPITTLQQALAQLGTSQIAQISLVIVCRTRAFDIKGRAAAARKMLRHAVAAGAYAREIGKLAEMAPEEAFLCGLLHDVGEPAVLQLASDLAQKHGLKLDDATAASELERLHQRVGGMIARSWKLSPLATMSAEAHHRQLTPDSPADMLAVIQLADTLADALLRKEEMPPANVGALPATQALRLTPEKIATLLARRDVVEATVDAIT
jgi:HD-like signal output (HDOD) protein